MKSYINREELIKTLEKIDVYKKEAQLCFININEKLKKMNQYYNTSNTDTLEVLTKELENKYSKIIENQNMDIMIINKTIEKYEKTAQEVATMFEL